MKSTIEILINEKKADEQRTSPEIVNKNKIVKVKYKVLKTKSTKVKKKSKATKEEESFMDKHTDLEKTNSMNSTEFNLKKKSRQIG